MTCVFLFDTEQPKSVADPDLQLRRGPSFHLLGQPFFLPLVISSFFTQNKEGGLGGGGGLNPSPRSATVSYYCISDSASFIHNIQKYWDVQQ